MVYKVTSTIQNNNVSVFNLSINNLSKRSLNFNIVMLDVYEFKFIFTIHYNIIVVQCYINFLSNYYFSFDWQNYTIQYTPYFKDVLYPQRI